MLAGCLVTTSYGQNTIEWRKDKVTQMIFPADIVKFRTGYIAGPSDNFDALTQRDGKVLYIQPVMPLDETNLNVVTSDGYYYAFNLVYNDAAKCVNYIIRPAMAFYQDESGGRMPRLWRNRACRTSMRSRQPKQCGLIPRPCFQR